MKEQSLSTWPTIAIFDFPHEITLLRSRMEAEEIPHFFKDELVAQTSYALAVGGIKLQVPAEHHGQVYVLFQELGLTEKLPQTRPTIDPFEQISMQLSQFPMLRGLPAEVRWLVPLAVFTISGVILLYILLYYLV